MQTIASLSVIPTGVQAEIPVIGVPGFLSSFPEDLRTCLTHEVRIDYSYPFGMNTTYPRWSAWGECLEQCLSCMELRELPVTFVTESMGLPLAILSGVSASKIIVRKVPLMGQQRQVAYDIIQGVVSDFDNKFEKLAQRISLLPNDKNAARLLYEYALESNIDEQSLCQFGGSILVLPYEPDTLHPVEALQYLEETAGYDLISLAEVHSECRR